MSATVEGRGFNTPSRAKYFRYLMVKTTQRLNRSPRVRMEEARLDAAHARENRS